ncbi:MAG: hypothetical protein LBT03_02090 [Holosporales bacterium]|jgi:hypothetical protein|nr:hypothetical protein [Holosporales bacterium]
MNRKAFICSLLFVVSACQNLKQEDAKIVSVEASKEVALAVSEFNTDLSEPTKLPKVRNVSKMIKTLYHDQRDWRFSSFIDSVEQNHSEIFSEGLAEYSKFVWKENANFIYDKQYEIQKYCNKYLTRKYLIKLYKFFGIMPPENFSLKVYLFPILKENFGFYGGDNKIFIQPMPYSISTHLGIIAHECSHVVYDKMDKTKMKQFYLNHRSGTGELVFNAMNEALAVAIGNRLLKIEIDEIEDEDSFAYSYIDDFSKELKHLVKEYMDSGKSMDESFFNKSIEIFNKIIPDSQNNLDILMYKINVFTNIKDQNYIIDAIRSSGFFCESIEVSRLSECPVTQESIEPYIYVIGNNEKCKFSIGKKDTLCVKKLANHKIVIVIQTNDKKKIKKAFRLLKNNFIVKKIGKIVEQVAFKI